MLLRLRASGSRLPSCHCCESSPRESRFGRRRWLSAGLAAAGYALGSTTAKQAPRDPSTLRARIYPPCFRMISVLTHNPSPVPFCFWLKNGSANLFFASPSNPRPESQMQTRTAFPPAPGAYVCRTRTAMRPFGPEASIAFRIRFANTWRRCDWLPETDSIKRPSVPHLKWIRSAKAARNRRQLDGHGCDGGRRNVAGVPGRVDSREHPRAT